MLLGISGLKTDGAVEKFLEQPGIAEQMRNKAGAGSAGANQTSPLITQARTFALRINPPAIVQMLPKKERDQVRPGPKVAEKTAKFVLIGTCYYPDDPARSWALINETGEGLYWVKSGSKVGHLTINEITDGTVSIDNGGRITKLVPTGRKKTKSLLKGEGTVDVGKEIQPSTFESQITVAAPTVSKAPGLSKEDLQSNIEFVKKLRDNPESMGVDKEEAKNLKDMGELLKSLEMEQIKKLTEAMKKKGVRRPNNEQRLPIRRKGRGR